MNKAIIRTRSLPFAATLLFPLALFSQTFAGSIAGTWEGESICTIRDSPCRDEHVVYEISRNATPQNASADARAALDWKMKAYKIVNGEKQSMGTLYCSFGEKKNNLSCLTKTRTEVDWEYFLDGDKLSGTLQIGQEKTLFRKVTAKRISGS